MRLSDADILIIPGLGNSGPGHWQTRWQARVGTALRVEQDEWERPDPARWSARIVDAVAAATKPVVLIAHSFGVAAVLHAAPLLTQGKVRGAFLVACTDVERADLGPFGFGRLVPIRLGERRLSDRVRADLHPAHSEHGHR